MKMKSKLPTNIHIYKSIEEFDQNLPKTVELLHNENGDKIYVIGTAHFSLKSQDDVSIVMRNVKPDAIILELCPLRLHILQLDEETLIKEATKLTPEKIKEILDKYGTTSGMFYISFLKTSAKITQELGVAPGGECRRAVAEALKIPNCKIYLGDRNIDITMERATAHLNDKQKKSITSAFDMLNKTENIITPEEVEKYRTKDGNQLNRLKEHMPNIYKTFVTERDIILAHSMYLVSKYSHNTKKHSGPTNVVGIVGIGHLEGITKNFGKTTDKRVIELNASTRRKTIKSSKMMPSSIRRFNIRNFLKFFK